MDKIKIQESIEEFKKARRNSPRIIEKPDFKKRIPLFLRDKKIKGVGQTGNFKYDNQLETSSYSGSGVHRMPYLPVDHNYPYISIAELPFSSSLNLYNIFKDGRLYLHENLYIPNICELAPDSKWLLPISYEYFVREYLHGQTEDLTAPSNIYMKDTLPYIDPVKLILSAFLDTGAEALLSDYPPDGYPHQLHSSFNVVISPRYEFLFGGITFSFIITQHDTNYYIVNVEEIECFLAFFLNEQIYANQFLADDARFMLEIRDGQIYPGIYSAYNYDYMYSDPISVIVPDYEINLESDIIVEPFNYGTVLSDNLSKHFATLSKTEIISALGWMLGGVYGETLLK
jgi:hypothetical protein